MVGGHRCGGGACYQNVHSQYRLARRIQRVHVGFKGEPEERQVIQQCGPCSGEPRAISRSAEVFSKSRVVSETLVLSTRLAILTTTGKNVPIRVLTDGLYACLQSAGRRYRRSH